MATIKKYNGSTWENAVVRKYGTASETIQSGDTIYADGQPITTYNIKGNEEHTGAPSPQNPVMPNGVGNKTANLLDLASWTNQNTDTRSYFQIVVLFMNDNTQLGKTSNIDVRTTGEKTIAINITEANCNRMQIKHNGSSRDLFIGNAYGEFYGEYTLSFNCVSNDPTTVNGIELQNIMLNTGSAALPYEPYGQYKIPISSGQTALNPIYLTGQLMAVESADTLSSSGTVTYQYKKYEIKGTEDTISGYTNSAGKLGFQYEKLDMVSNSRTNGVCSHFVPIQSISWTTKNSICFGANNQAIYFIFSDEIATQYNLTDITSIKQWLADQYAAGTPVTIVYPLATPTTETVTVPTIPTTDGANTITVDTTVQPSEFTATWTGWHDAEVKEKSENLLDYKVLFSNSFVKETASFKYYRITVTANTQYTLKSNAPASVENVVTTFLFGRSDTMSTANDGLYTDVAKTITSTDDGYVYIAVRKAGTSTTIPAVSETDFDNGTYTIMLNTGSTALPYEPYWK